MPFLGMFKSRRSRSTSLPRHQERYLHDSHVYDQASAYGPRHTSGLTRAAHHQHYPPYGGPSSPDSGAKRYSESSTSDRSWYRVERPEYHHDPRERDIENYSYTEGSDRYSDISGPGMPVDTISESSRVESPVPTVYRQETPALGSRMFEQFARSPPAQVTRLDLQESVDGEYEGAGFDPRQRGVLPPHPQDRPGHSAFASGLHRHHSQRQRQRRPSQHAFQEPIRVNLTSDTGSSDVAQVLENGDRTKIPRHPYERRGSGGPRHTASESHGRPSPQRTYYIVPPGMSVIFRDEYGNELKRVGDFTDAYDPDMYDEAPVEVKDEHGRIVYKTGENYTDDGSDVSEATNRPKVVHLGQYVSNGMSPVPRPSSPLTISLDRRGYHQHIHLEHSEDGSFGGSQGSFNPRLSHAHSEGNLANFGPGNYRSRLDLDRVKLRTIYHPN